LAWGFDKRQVQLLDNSTFRSISTEEVFAVKQIDSVGDLIPDGGNNIFSGRIVVETEKFRAEATRESVLRSITQCYRFVEGLRQINMTARAS
jgi:hypothetical protein